MYKTKETSPKFKFKNQLSDQKKYYGTYLIPEEINRNVAVDLGSNMGFFVADYHDAFESLYAIDASYENFVETLKRVLYLNLKEKKAENVVCFNLAAANKTGEIVKVYRHDYNGQSVSPMTQTDMFTSQYPQWDESKETYHNVTSVSLEGLYELLGVNYIDYLKIDIEGAEYPFLLGQDLSRIGALALELHGTLGSAKKEEMKKYLERYFEIYDIQYDHAAPRHSVITYINKTLSKK